MSWTTWKPWTWRMDGNGRTVLSVGLPNRRVLVRLVLTSFEGELVAARLEDADRDPWFAVAGGVLRVGPWFLEWEHPVFSLGSDGEGRVDLDIQLRVWVEHRSNLLDLGWDGLNRDGLDRDTEARR